MKPILIMKKSLLLSTFFFGLLITINAQVTSVKYLLEYNDATSHYDVKIVAEEGSATTVPQRTQFNSQITVVIPTGSTISIGEFFNPIENNQTYTGTTPIEWIMGNGVIAPPAQPDEDFYNFFPSLAPVGSYNDIFAGDVITLFSLNINVEPCENSVRFFENGTDPSAAEMPDNGNYSNGFTLGSVEQIYDGNLPSWYDGDWSVSLDDYAVCGGECVELTPNLICSSEDLTYVWSTGETTPTITVCPNENTTYSVQITNPVFEVLNLESSVSVIPVLAAPNIASNSPLCEGDDIELTADFVPGVNYLWTDPNGVTYNEQNLTISSATSANSGTYTCSIEKDGCTSISSAIDINVGEMPIITITGPTAICFLGTTTLTPASGGTWNSSDSEVATITNSGVVTGVGEGKVVFQFTNTTMGCTALSEQICVFDNPDVAYTGEDRLCIGETTTVVPNVDGTWTSSDVTVGTITNAGLVTAVAQGTCSFTFTDVNTGCTAITTGLIVDPVPSVSSESSDICIGSSTTLSPSAGGSWEALNTGIASLVGNTVTGVSSGEAAFVFTADATGCVSDILLINVETGPVTNLTGPSEICVGGTTTIEPSVGGTWSSDNVSIATIDNFGNITGVSPGVVRFTFTSSTTLCYSEPSEPVLVLPKPEVSASSMSACINETINLTPSSAGTWASSDNTVATVNTFTGEVLTVGAGTVIFTFTSSENGCSSSTETITVNSGYFDGVEDPLELCVGTIAGIDPNPDGTWVSDNPSAVSVDFDSGVITAVTGGNALLTFTSDETGCPSNLAVIAHDVPNVSITGEDEICVGETTTVSSSTSGTWFLNDPTIANIDNLGNVTGLNPGSSILIFIDDATGCSASTQTITIHSVPVVSITGPEIVCFGSTTSVSPTTGGSWTSDNPLIASIDNAGNITPVSEGFVTFSFYDGQCASTTSAIQVVETIMIDIDTMICEGMEYNGYTETGIYTIDSVDAVTGCDIITTIDLEVLPLSDPSCIVGIDELESSKIALYPNPASEMVFVKSELAIESISIYNTSYQKLEVESFEKISNEIQIATNNLNQGLYFIAIKSSGKLIYKKLIIE